MLKIIAVIVVLCLAERVRPQARFLRPISRASAFRDPDYDQFNPPENYDDHRINCGNVIQEEVVGGNCGLCGDPYTDPAPRKYEMGGVNYRGFFTGSYISGGVVDVEAEITFSKNGYMEWRLCTTPFSGETQACFNRYLLEQVDGSGSKVYVTTTGVYRTQLQLPQGVTCQHCVIQWNYRVANNWGVCPNGTGIIGCGPQETFRNCADVNIN